MSLSYASLLNIELFNIYIWKMLGQATTSFNYYNFFKNSRDGLYFIGISAT
jgi:hypothetical protein